MEQKATVDADLVYADGYQAGRLGLSRDQNPHKGVGDASIRWFAGWDDGAAVRAWLSAVKEARQPRSTRR
jgi:ribosome modulation factor